VGHNILIAHGSAVKVYREEFKARDGGEIGMTLNGRLSIPTLLDSEGPLLCRFADNNT